MVNNYYYFDRFNNNIVQHPYQPKNDNWFISAGNANTTTYFPTMSSFNHWAETCCGGTYQAVRSGRLGAYDIRLNK